MSDDKFIDYYELLQLSPNADAENIEPDNAESPDITRFSQIVEAHRALADPETRAGYDARHQDYWNRKWRLASEASYNSAFGDDQVIRERLLSLLYVQRRRNMDSPGIGEPEIARLLGSPPELMGFHLWYLKAKGRLERLESGYFAITAAGVDQVEQSRLRLSPDHLIEAPHHVSEDTEDGDGNLTRIGVEV